MEEKKKEQPEKIVMTEKKDLPKNRIEVTVTLTMFITELAKIFPNISRLLKKPHRESFDLLLSLLKNKKGIPQLNLPMYELAVVTDKPAMITVDTQQLCQGFKNCLKDIQKKNSKKDDVILACQKWILLFDWLIGLTSYLDLPMEFWAHPVLDEKQLELDI